MLTDWCGKYCNQNRSNLGRRLQHQHQSEESVQAYDILPPSEKKRIDKFFNLTGLIKYEEEDGCRVPPHNIWPRSTR
jgi:hypothetical protein